MPNLDNLLTFTSAGASSASTTSPLPPFSSHVVITDTLDSPASFVLIHFLRAANAVNKTIRSTVADRKAKGKEVRVVWLGCNADGIGHLRNVARKSGIQVDLEAQKGAFAYIDADAVTASSAVPLSSQLDASEVPPPALQGLYEKVKTHLERANEPDSDEQHQHLNSWRSSSIIIIDDLSALSWSLSHSDTLGRPVDVASQISKWIQALSSLALKYRASLISLSHADATSVGKHAASDSVDESVFRSLLRSADVWVEVKELVSGRARDCDGEITVHSLVRPSLARNIDTLASVTSPELRKKFDPPPLSAFKIETPCPSRSKAVLYRIAPDGQSGALNGSGAGSNTGRVHVWARGTGRGFL